MPGGSHAAALSRAAWSRPMQAVFFAGSKAVSSAAASTGFLSSAWSRAQRSPRISFADPEAVRFLDPAPVIGGGRPPVIGERDGKPPAGAFDHRIGPVLDRELRLEAGGDAPGEETLLGVRRQRRERGEAFGRRQFEPVEIERAALRLDQPVRRRCRRDRSASCAAPPRSPADRADARGSESDRTDRRTAHRARDRTRRRNPPPDARG